MLLLRKNMNLEWNPRKFAKSKRHYFDVIFAIFNCRFEHEGDLISTRRNSEEIFALTRAFFRGVKLENRTCRSEVRKLALFRENR